MGIILLNRGTCITQDCAKGVELKLRIFYLWKIVKCKKEDAEWLLNNVGLETWWPVNHATSGLFTLL